MRSIGIGYLRLAIPRVSPETRLQFTLTLRLALKSVFNRRYAIRLVVMFIILQVMTITTMRFGPPYETTEQVFEYFVATYTQFSYYVLYTLIPISGLLFSSKSFRLQVQTLTSHPVDKRFIFLSRVVVAVVIVAFFQATSGISILIQRWLFDGSERLWTKETFGILTFIVPILITSVLIALCYTSMMVILPNLFRRPSIAYVLNLILIWVWDAVAGLSFLDGPYRKDQIFAPVSPAALARSIFLNIMYPHRISIDKESMGFWFTPQFLVFQFIMTAVQVGLCLYIAWRLFDHRSRQQ